GVVSLTPSDESQSSSTRDGAPAGVLFIAPVRARHDGAEKLASDGPDADRSTLALIELHQRPDASPSAHRGSEQFLAAVSELAADYHAFRELRILRGEDKY